jgi:hypothetical protein
MVPAEFIGRARALRMAVAAVHPVAIATIDRIGQSLHGQYRLRQTPSASGLARAAAAWRDQVPSAGRLDLMVKVTSKRLAISETRIGPVEFRFDAWIEGDAETAIVITRTVLEVSAGRFWFDHTPVALVSLHGLARRYQRAFDMSDAAVCADLYSLATAGGDVEDGEFAVPAGDGQWVGNVAEVEDRGEPVRILAARSFRSEDMGTRAAKAPAPSQPTQPHGA